MKKKLFKVGTQNFISPSGELPPHSNASDTNRFGRTDTEVIAALDKLPEHYRSVVLQPDDHEFDYKEVAAVLDIPIGTVMPRLNRARTQLRKSLADVAKGYKINLAA